MSSGKNSIVDEHVFIDVAVVFSKLSIVNSTVTATLKSIALFPLVHFAFMLKMSRHKCDVVNDVINFSGGQPLSSTNISGVRAPDRKVSPKTWRILRHNRPTFMGASHRYRRYRSPTGPERRDIFKIQDGGASGQKAQVTWENNTNMGIFQHGLCKIYIGFGHDFGFI